VCTAQCFCLYFQASTMSTIRKSKNPDTLGFSNRFRSQSLVQSRREIWFLTSHSSFLLDDTLLNPKSAEDFRHHLGRSSNIASNYSNLQHTVLYIWSFIKASFRRPSALCFKRPPSLYMRISILAMTSRHDRIGLATRMRILPGA
jgi:hypothetical protein